MIADYEGDPKTLIEDQEEGLYPTLCMRDIVVFPTNMTPIVVGRKESLNLVRMLEKKRDTIFCVFCQKNKDTESPYEEDLYPVGVFAKLIKVIKMPGTEQMSIIIEGLGRCQMKHLVQKEPYTVIDVKVFRRNGLLRTTMNSSECSMRTSITKRQTISNQTPTILMRPSRPSTNSRAFTCSATSCAPSLSPFRG